jgi:hypothetical protein
MPKALILKQLIPKVASSIAEFEKEIKAGNGAIGKAWKEDNELSDGLIRKILKRYSKVNEKWLETGEGSMFLPDHQINPIAKPQEPQPDTNKQNDTTMEQDQQEWKQAYKDLIEAHKAYAQSQLILSKALDKIVDKLNKMESIEISLNKAVDEQLAYHAAIADEHKILFEAMDDLRHLPEGSHAKKADSVHAAHLQKIAKKDTVDS